MSLRVFSFIKDETRTEFCTLLSLVCLLLPFVTQQASAQNILSDKAQSSLLHLLKQDCGSCHGMRLTGGLGPELTSNTMKKLGAKNIFTVIKYGRPGTAMPPWQAILNDDEIQFIADQLVVGVEE